MRGKGRKGERENGRDGERKEETEKEIFQEIERQKGENGTKLVGKEIVME